LQEIRMTRPKTTRLAILCSLILAAGLTLFLMPRAAWASTYAAYLPLDDSIYDELQTLNDLGLLDSYVTTVKPIARVEAARLVVEAESNLSEQHDQNQLALSILKALHAQLSEEIEWIEKDHEDNLPTMVHPVERVELEYINSQGKRRKIQLQNGINFQEGTPLLPYNDNLATDQGSNEAARWAGWTGVAGFITGYGEGAIAGPLTKDIKSVNRAQLLTGAAVVSLGNTAISFGQEEMSDGVGYFGDMSQTNNGLPFPALRARNIHPGHMPFFLKYLGLLHYDVFFGQLDAGRVYSRPWISGQVFGFRTLPWLEWGVAHDIIFGGSGNDNYSAMGFLGRATALNTGSAIGADSHQWFEIFAKIYVPQIRNSQLYGEIRGDDFYEPLGHDTFLKVPLKSPSYIGGFYCPELTLDGRTTGRLEWQLTDRNYSVHAGDSLYYTYQDSLMGNALGPGAWNFNVDGGRWLTLESKLDLSLFYTYRVPPEISDLVKLPGFDNKNETTVGFAFDFLHLPVEFVRAADSLGEMRARTGVEYVSNLNYTTHTTVRALVQLSFGLTPGWPSFVWH
jgi:Capsule assembly protein Wzi